MLANNNKERVLEQFFISPTTEFELRELSRKTKIAPTSVKNYLTGLIKEKLVLKKFHRIRKYPLYIARFNDKIYRFYKKLWIQRKLFDIGLIDFIYDTYMPDCIILFGSASRGEDHEDSDIDIFIQAKRRGRYEIETELKKYGNIMKRKINPYFQHDFNSMSDEFKANVTNSVILDGFLEIEYGKKNTRSPGQEKGHTNSKIHRKKSKSNKKIRNK